MPGTRARTRRLLSLVLVVLGSLFLLIGGLAIYTERNLVDSDRFADRAVHALDDQATRDEIGAIVAEQLEQANPDLIAFRAIIESGVSGLAGTEPFKAALRAAVAQAHRSALGRDRDDAAVTIANFGVLATETLRALAPDVAKEIPDGFRAELISFADGGAGTDVVQIDLGAIPIVAPILAVLLLALGALAANDRRRGLAAAALGVAAVGVIGLVGFELGRTLVGNAAADAGGEAAARALWNSMLADLAHLSLALAFAGIVLAGAASSLLRPLDFAALLRRGRRALERQPSTAVGQVARALVLIVAGGLVLVAPEMALRLAAVAVGLMLAFLGASELLALIAGPDEPAPAAPATGTHARIARPLLVGALAALGLAGIVAVASSDDTGESPAPSGCNGSEELCDLPLADVTLAATHNAMSAADYPGFLFPMHDRTIPGQLGDGVRALLIDAYYGFPGRRVYTDFERGPNKLTEETRAQFGPEFQAAAGRVRGRIAQPEGESQLYLCHGFCELGAIDLTETLSQVNGFIKQNPGEVILIVIEDYADPADIVAAFEESGLADHAYDGPITSETPTLGDLVESGKQVVVLAENRAGEAPWYRLAYDFFQETGYDFKRPEDMDCAPNRGDPGNPLFLINNWINTDPAALPSNARKVNDKEFLLDRARRCARQRDAMPNVIAVDFYREGNVIGVADELTSASAAGE